MLNDLACCAATIATEIATALNTPAGPARGRFAPAPTPPRPLMATMYAGPNRHTRRASLSPRPGPVTPAAIRAGRLLRLRHVTRQIAAQEHPTP